MCRKDKTGGKKIVEKLKKITTYQLTAKELMEKLGLKGIFISINSPKHFSSLHQPNESCDRKKDLEKIPINLEIEENEN